MPFFKNSANIVLFFLVIFYNNSLAQPNHYPYLDATFSKAELENKLQEYGNNHDTLGMAYTYWAYAKNQERGNHLNESPITNLRKSMECFLIVKDSNNFYKVRGEIGSYFMDRPFIKQYAKEYIEGALKFFRQKKFYDNELEYLINLANIYIHENNFVKGKEHLERVEFLLTKVKNETAIGRLESSYSDFFSRQKQFDKALLHAQKSLEIGKKLNIDWLQALSYYISAQCMKGLNRPDEMLDLLLKSKKITEGNINLLQLGIEVNEEIRQFYFLKKDFPKSYEYAMKIKESTQALYFSKIEGDVRSFNEYHLLEEQKMIISKIELEKKLAESEIEKLKANQQLFIAIIIVTLMFFMLTIFAFFSRQRLNKLKNQELNKNIYIEKLNSLINGQEQERLRVAQELHDGLGTLLSRIKIFSSTGMSNEKMVNMIDEACSEVRTISGNLQPSSLSKFGLIRAIQDLINKQNVKSPEIIFQHFGEPLKMDNNKNLMIYRIVQELLTNSLKHSNATEILVQIVFSDDQNLTITVEDNGVGFDEQESNEESQGWPNIRSRVNYLEGNINLHVNKNEGTSVTISIPSL
jgi:signal transduction histidine kinase